MAAETNGRPREPSKVNARPNGVITSSKTQPRRDPPSKVRRRLFSLITRLLAWYAVVTALFRCPSSAADITDNSPVVCKPYLTSRSFVAPYIEPYYNEYAAPYLNAVRPYTASFEQNIYNPSVEFGKQSYKTYGAPRVLQAKVYGQDQWKMNLRPKIHTYQSQAKQYYDVSVAPQLEKARVVAEPYYILNRDCVLRVYDSYILPAYSACRPYADKAYAVGEKFAVETGIPYAKSTWASTVILFDRTIWPQIRILYGENVEPQLVRIRERLGRYRDGKRLKTAFEDIDSTPEPSAAESSISSGPSTISSATLTESSEESSVAVSEESSQPSLTPEQEEEKVRETIANDLKNWQEKFAKAADKGTEDLEQRVKEITDRQINSQVQGVGEALIVQLEETSKSECSKFKKAVQKIVKGLSEEGSSEDAHKAEEELSAAVRQAGLSIRGKAQALRNWKEAFDRETISLVHAASESTLEVIDNIRDLGLQEIGMRWAWMDGVTYKDWSKYHEVRKTFDMWRTEVGSVATDHEGFKRAKDAAIDIESRGMAVAEETAKELGRLKEVGKWKIQAADTSDDFSSKHVPPGVAGIAQKVMKQASSASEQLTGTPQGAADGQKTSEAASTASSKIAGIEEQDSEKVNPAAKGNAGQGSDQVSEAIIGTPPPAHESVAPEALNLASSASSAFSPAPEPSTPLGESSSNAGSSTSQTPKKIYNGAMAQEVRGQKPILEDLVDDDATYSEKIQSFIEQAGEKYTDITNAVNEALLKATRTQGTAESITSVAGEKYSEALLAASRALLGTEKGAIESVTNVASERYVEAVAAASSAIFGTPTPTLTSLAAEASSVYAEAASRAKAQYSHAKSIASEQISGSSKPVHQAMFSSIEKAYSDSLNAASRRMESALEALDSQQAAISKTISEAYYGPTQRILESISSVASSKLADGLRTASAQYSSVKSVAGATPTPVYQQYIMDGSRRYYEAVGLAHDRYSEFVTAASGAVFGSPTPTYQNFFSAASESIYGTPQPAHQSIMDAAQSQYGAAVVEASEKLQAVLVSASSVVGKTPASPAQSILESASSQYSSAVAFASASLSSASAAASASLYGTAEGRAESIVAALSEQAESIASTASAGVIGRETPWTESIASQASTNWEALVSKASEQVYGAPTPWSESFMAQANQYASQAAGAASAEYKAVQALFKELISGREPDFTESVMNRLKSAYSTDAMRAASSASSYVGDTYASASSVASTFFTPPASLEAIFQAASDQLNAAVNKASQQVYGTSKGKFEQATSAAAGSYAAAASRASEAVYGTQSGLAAEMQASFEQVASSAQEAISQAIYGTTAATDSVTRVVGNAYASVSSAVQENMSSASSAMEAAQAKVSEAIYGPEKGTVESASLRLVQAIESAKARLAAFQSDARGGVEAAKKAVEDAASSVSSVAAKATDRVRDEL